MERVATALDVPAAELYVVVRSGARCEAHQGLPDAVDVIVADQKTQRSERAPRVNGEHSVEAARQRVGSDRGIGGQRKLIPNRGPKIIAGRRLTCLSCCGQCAVEGAVGCSRYD